MSVSFAISCDDPARILAGDPPGIISLTRRIEPLDPLQVLHLMARAGEAHWYFRSGSGPEMVAAGSVLSLAAMTPERFAQAKAVVVRTPIDRDSPDSGVGPRFMGCFPFLAQSWGIVPAITLPRWQLLRRPEGCTLTLNAMLGGDPAALNQAIEELCQRLRQPLPPVQVPSSQSLDLDQVPTPGLKQVIWAALRAIDAGDLEKVVIAHARDVRLSAPVQVQATLHSLRAAYPDCYVFLVADGRGKAFFGASPERLLRVEGGRFYTDALAGSAPRGRSPAEDRRYAQQLLASFKDRHEHALVVRSIVERLAQLGSTPQPHASAVLRQLPNIHHLHTAISGSVPAGMHPLDLVAALHPTAAVAGLPCQAACQFIAEHEPFERGLYAAPIGWVDAEGQAEFAVGIRSALVEGATVRLYGGAGIVAASDPEREMAEIHLKLGTLLSQLVF